VSHRVAVVGDSTVSMGFHLTGLRPFVADSKEEAASLLADMARDPQWGVILVQEDLLPEAMPSVPGGSDAGLPIVVPFPDPAGVRPPDEAEAYVAELLRRAVGYRVRLR
jgi:vacuolar-type H+-ATPase subunit F/Vma7